MSAASGPPAESPSRLLHRGPESAELKGSGRVIDTSEHNESAAAASAPAPTGRGLALALATAGGAGYAPIAPGTFGSAVGVLLYLGLAGLGAPLFGLTLVALLFLGIWASDRAERIFGVNDDGRIVIDEVVGQLIALAPLLPLAPGRLRAPLLLAAGFFVFRLFDIWKPGPVGWAERYFEGGAGGMMDDVVAGLFTAVVVAALAWGTGR